MTIVIETKAGTFTLPYREAVKAFTNADLAEHNEAGFLLWLFSEGYLPHKQ